MAFYFVSEEIQPDSSRSPRGEALNAFWVLCVADKYSKANLRIEFVN